MLISIRDVKETPQGKEIKPFSIAQLATIVNKPLAWVKLLIKPGTVVEMAIKIGIVDSVTYHRLVD